MNTATLRNLPNARRGGIAVPCMPGRDRGAPGDKRRGVHGTHGFVCMSGWRECRAHTPSWSSHLRPFAVPSAV